MKNRQFIVLLIIITIQTFLFYFKLKEIREQETYIYSTAMFNGIDTTHIRETTDEILEITAKSINGIY